MTRKKKEETQKENLLCDEKQTEVFQEKFETEAQKEKLDIIKEVVANQKKKECVKQRQIYNAMNRITVERKG